MLDPTLAFAAFGAAHYDSFPIAVLPVALENELEEFLLCFNGETLTLRQFPYRCVTRGIGE